jgi:hypothetical protein
MSIFVVSFLPGTKKITKRKTKVIMIKLVNRHLGFIDCNRLCEEHFDR